MMRGLLVAACLLGIAASLVVPPSDSNIQYSGRVDYSTYGFEWPGIEILAYFTGTSVGVILTSKANMYNVFVDGTLVTVLNTTSAVTTYPISSNLPSGTHSVLVTKRTESFYGPGVFGGFVIDDGSSLVAPPPLSGRRVEFLGDSITVGFGVDGVAPCGYTEDTENNYNAYGAVTARMLGAQFSVEAWSGIGLVHNGGDTNQLSADPLPVRFPFVLPGNYSVPYTFSWVPQAVVINLGTNDFGGTVKPTQEQFETGYVSFIANITKSYNPPPQFFLVCGPMESMTYCPYTQNVATQVGATYVNLDGILVTGDWGCDGHPGISGQWKMANATAAAIQAVLKW